MAANGEFYERIDHPTEINQLLEALSRPGGASLSRDGAAPEAALPVVVETDGPGTPFRLDVSAIRDRPEVRALRAGDRFRVCGRDGSGLIRTAVLAVQKSYEQDGRLWCHCEAPRYMEKLQRRDAFRARLRRGMHARVDLYVGGASATGRLRDLSLHGCLVELDASAIAMLDDQTDALHVELSFPDGSRFSTRGWPRHEDRGDRDVLCGFQFEDGDHRQGEQLWQLVREIEREAARSATSERSDLRPSPLFVGAALASDSAPGAGGYRTPSARRLARIAAFLTGQIVRLRQGGCIDPAGLSEHADQLLALQRDDREALLFALACITRELPLVRHCLAVAARLVDFGATLGLGTSVLKALGAAGMVHDLGKVLLPATLRDARQLSAAQYLQVQDHVALIKERLAECRWLSPVAVAAVIEGANERMDGSGYPQHRTADKLHELMRLAAVVDAADALARPRPDRAPRPIEAVLRHLRDAPGQFDPRWVERYVDHFGTWPVGTLLGFAGGAQGWVLGLNDRHEPAALRVVVDAAGADVPGGNVVRGDALARLGEPLGQVLPPA